MGPCTANARWPTVNSWCRGTTIICCVADLRCCLPTTSMTGMQQPTRYCGALPCRHLCMNTSSLYVTWSATSSQCKSSCKIWVRRLRPWSNFLVSLTTRAAAFLACRSDWLRGSGKYGIAVVHSGGHECMNKCSRWLRVKWSSDMSELMQPVKRCCRHVRHVTLQTQVRRDCHSEQMDVVLQCDGVCSLLEWWTATSQRRLTVSLSSPE